MMAKYINADALIEEIEKIKKYDYFDETGNIFLLLTHRDVENAIKRQPAADVVEVVRCKDCKHNPNEAWFSCPAAHLSERQRPEDAWCWRGERGKMPKYINADELKAELLMMEHRFSVCEEYGAEGRVLWSRELIHREHIEKAIDKCSIDNATQRWIPCSSGNLPQTTDPVNITWTNRNPEPYYASIKDVPFTATGHYCNGKWWWYSSTCQDYLDEYGESEVDRVDDGIEILAWQPLPEPYKADMNNL